MVFRFPRQGIHLLEDGFAECSAVAESGVFQVGRPCGKFGIAVAAAAGGAAFPAHVQSPRGSRFRGRSLQSREGRGEEGIPLAVFAATLITPLAVLRGIGLVVEGMQRIGDEAESVVIGGIGGRRVDHVVIALSVYFVSDAAGPSIVRDFTPAGSNFKKSSIDDVFPPIQAQFPPSSPPLP